MLYIDPFLLQTEQIFKSKTWSQKLPEEPQNFITRHELLWDFMECLKQFTKNPKNTGSDTTPLLQKLYWTFCFRAQTH